MELGPDEGIVSVEMHDDKVIDIVVRISWFSALTSDE